MNKFNVMPHLNVFIYDQLIRNKMQNIREGLTALENMFEQFQESSALTFSSLCFKNEWSLHGTTK